MLDWLSDPEQLRNAMRRLVDETSQVDIAVAFWGKNPLERIPLNVRKTPRTRVIVNLRSGGTNPAAVRDLLREFGSERVRQLNDLHAKVLISDTHVISGSANVSTNGLGLEGNEQIGWREVCIRTNESNLMKSARLWFDSQWIAGTLIEESDLLDAEDAWNKRRRARPLVRGPDDLGVGGVLAFQRETLLGRRLVIALTSEDPSPKTSRIISKAKHSDPSIDGYDGWPDMPLDAVLLAFGLNRSRGKLSVFWDGFWETPKDKPSLKENTIDGVTLVRPPHRDHALEIPASERKAWERDVKVLCELFRSEPNRLPSGQVWDDWFMPVEQAWDLLSELRLRRGKIATSRSSSAKAAGPTSFDHQSILDSVSDESIRQAIRAVSVGGGTFRTTDIIRRIAKRYLKDSGIKPSESPNARFARRISRDRKKLGIRLVRRDEDVKDDNGGRSMTSRWELA